MNHRERYVHSESIMRDRAVIAGASPDLEPHYRPWSCPNSTETAKVIARMLLSGDADAAVDRWTDIEYWERIRGKRDDMFYDYDPTTLTVVRR